MYKGGGLGGLWIKGFIKGYMGLIFLEACYVCCVAQQTMVQVLVVEMGEFTAYWSYFMGFCGVLWPYTSAVAVYYPGLCYICLNSSLNVVVFVVSVLALFLSFVGIWLNIFLNNLKIATHTC